MNLLAWSVVADIDIDTLAGWAVVFSGLSVVGVLWIIHSLHKLGMNQIKLGVMLEELLKRTQR